MIATHFATRRNYHYSLTYTAELKRIVACDDIVALCVEYTMYDPVHHTLSFVKNPVVAQWLLDTGDQVTETLIQQSILQGQHPPDVVALFIDAIATPTVTPNYRQYMVDACCVGAHAIVDMLYRKCYSKCPRVLENLPLRIATDTNDVFLVQYLLDHGVDVHTDDDYLLRHSSEMGYFDLTYLALSRGANVHVQGETPLLNARGLKVHQLLLAYGAVIPPRYRQQVLDNLMEFHESHLSFFPSNHPVSDRFYDVIELLLEHGAIPSPFAVAKAGSDAIPFCVFRLLLRHHTDYLPASAKVILWNNLIGRGQYAKIDYIFSVGKERGWDIPTLFPTMEYYCKSLNNVIGHRLHLIRYIDDDMRQDVAKHAESMGLWLVCEAVKTCKDL
jgi:hypothetical protein